MEGGSSKDDWATFVKSEAKSANLKCQFVETHISQDLSDPLINFRDWKKKQALQSRVNTSIPSSNKPPGGNTILYTHKDPGHIPSPSELRSLLLSHYSNSSTLPAHVLQEAHETLSTSKVGELLTSIFSLHDPESVLDAYLFKRGDSSLVSGVSEVIEALETPAAKGASFKSIIGPLIEIGALGRELVRAKASEGSPGALRDYALGYLEAADFHQHLATSCFESNRPNLQGAETKPMRWRGCYSEYCVATPSQPLEGSPAIVLVHGFGAFGEQWRDNLTALSSAGYHVYAPTLIGFGRSEKAAIGYSQDSWRDFIRDFILTEVKRPVILAGNSIGGFISTSVAGDFPSLVKGLVLLNSAGPIDPSFDVLKWEAAVRAKRPPPRLLVEVISRGLFWYLELGIQRTLKWLYVADPDRADSWLDKEIGRAANDPGSLEVFQSAFYLPPPRPLNYLINELYRGPTLVLQGALDPLNDAKKRAEDLKAASPATRVILLKAGHCPHDDDPESVNRGILEFASSILSAV